MNHRLFWIIGLGIWLLLAGSPTRAQPPLTGKWREEAVWPAHVERLTALLLTSDGKSLISAGGGWNGPGEVTVWEAEHRRKQRSFEGHEHRVRALAISPDGKLLASGGGVWNGRGLVILHDLKSGRRRQTFYVDSGQVLSVAFSPDGKRLATGSGYFSGDAAFGELKVFDIETGTEPVTFAWRDGPIYDVRFSPDGKWLATAGWYFDRQQRELAEVNLWDPRTGDRKRRLIHEPDENRIGKFYCIAFSPDGRLLAAGGRKADTEGIVRLWQVESGADFGLFGDAHANVWSLAFTPDSRTLATGGADDGLIQFWDVETARNVAQIESLDGATFSLAFTPDGRGLFAGGTNAAQDGGLIKTWKYEP
jgi:WD40 repeat protein